MDIDGQPSTQREQVAARALAWCDQHEELRSKARRGSKESRAMYRRMAARAETMVGVLISIARATPDVP